MGSSSAPLFSSTSPTNCGEHGVTVLAGGAVQTAEVLVKGKGRMGVACPGKPIDQIGQHRARAGEQDVDGLHGSFPYVSPRQRGKSIIYIQNQYSISKVPLPLKRFFWPKYCKKGQKQQPKAVFRALGCCFSQVFQAVNGSGEQFTNRGTLCLSRRCEHPMQGICSRIHGRLPDRCNTYSIPHRFLRSYGCRVPGRVRPRIR